MLSTTFVDLLIALGLGLLVGLQKERAGSPMAGLKTFALVCLMGAVAAILGDGTPWLVIAGLFAVTTLMVAGNVVMTHGSAPSPGQTTEAAALLTYLIGAMVVMGPREAAIVLGATVAVLLHLRETLKGWVARLSDKDARAVMQFVAISLVVLPILPNETFGPYDVLNPRQIWLMVVLIVGLNLAGYAAFRVLGQRAGTVLAGILGGVISSTATTMSYAGHTKSQPETARAAVAVVWIASGVVFVRILLEIGAVSPGFLQVAAGPMAVMLVVFAVLALVIWRDTTGPKESPMEPGNPSELRPAIVFGALYAGVLFLVAAAQDLLGDTGLFAAAFVSGLTDIDAITLSTSQLVETGVVQASTGWRLVLVAAMSNMVFKLGLAVSLGSREMSRRLVALFAVAVVVGVALLFAWS